MNSIAGKENHCPRNADVQEAFVAIIKNTQLKSYWMNYIKGRINRSIIGTYLKNCNEDDIFGKLTLKIFVNELTWNKDVYAGFKDFMYGQIHNIMRNIEICIIRKIEEDKDNGKEERLFIAEPTNDFKMTENFMELVTDGFESGMDDNKDKYDYYKSNLDGSFNPEKFNETVLVVLKHPKDTELLAVYTGRIVNKMGRQDILKEYGLTLEEYKRIWKRMMYKLRKEMPKRYSVSTVMVMHLLYNFYRNIYQPFL
jgi:hypothetical protein